MQKSVMTTLGLCMHQKAPASVPDSQKELRTQQDTTGWKDPAERAGAGLCQSHRRRCLPKKGSEHRCPHIQTEPLALPPPPWEPEQLCGAQALLLPSEPQGLGQRTTSGPSSSDSLLLLQATALPSFQSQFKRHLLKATDFKSDPCPLQPSRSLSPCPSPNSSH